jgi:hypothetical protein
MLTSLTSSSDGCIEGKLKLIVGNCVPAIINCSIESLEGERHLDMKLEFVGNQVVNVQVNTGYEKQVRQRRSKMLKKNCDIIAIDTQALVLMAKINFDVPDNKDAKEALV